MLTPPHEVLEFLGDLESAVIREYEFTKTRDFSKVRSDAKVLLDQIVAPNYETVDSAVYNFILEPLKNAHLYGASDVALQVLYSQKGLVFSFNDQSDYFRQPRVKAHWEQRRPLPDSTDMSHPQAGFGMGAALIYTMADLIFVDSATSTLYTGLRAGGNYIGKQSARNIRDRKASLCPNNRNR
jgi:hypothetical protein